MNNDRITERLRQIVEAAGLEIRQERHPGSLRVEFATTPPLTWSYADCDRATDAIYGAPLVPPDESGRHPNGKTEGTVGDHFSTDHGRTHDHWCFRLETLPEELIVL